MIGVCIATYNQEEYIAQCIESVLMQVCQLPIRLYIGTDCSTDSTAAICQQYANQYPNIQLYNRARGVIPPCEGIYRLLYPGSPKAAVTRIPRLSA